MAFNLSRFWKKGESETETPVSHEQIHEIPLFSSLTPQELKIIETKARRVEFKKGDIVYRIGEHADALYIVLSGRFVMTGVSGQAVATLSRGDCFGESSLLSGRPHSAMIQARNNSLVLKILKEDFHALIEVIPSLSVHLSRTMSHRLATGLSESKLSETKILSICDFGFTYEKRLFAWDFAAILANVSKKKVVLVFLEVPKQRKEEDSLTDDHPSVAVSLSEFELALHRGAGAKFIGHTKDSFDYFHVGNKPEEVVTDKQISHLLGYLIDRYDFILLSTPEKSNFGLMSIKAIQQSDLIYYLVNEKFRAAEMIGEFLAELRNSFGFMSNEIRVILCETEDHAASEDLAQNQSMSELNVFLNLPAEKFQDRRLQVEQHAFAILNPDSKYTHAIRYLGRELSGKLVGLALGGGAAFGLAHIGVLRVFEEAKIPIDVIAGSSIGALIGVLWAAGYSSYEIEKIALKLDRWNTFPKLVGMTDLSIPHFGFFKGNQVSRYFRNYLGHKTFRDLSIPVKIVTANLNTGEAVIHQEGDVVDALRASVSIPGIFWPVKYKKQYLIDGGVVDPLPVRVLSAYGAKKLIAVNVMFSPEDNIKHQEIVEQRRNAEQVKSQKRNRLLSAIEKFFKHFKKETPPTIFNVLMNTIQFLEFGIAEANAKYADVVIHPVIPDSHWAEFFSPQKFILVGEKCTRERIEEIRKLVEDDS